MVIGLGRSGYAAANLLTDLGAKVWVSDKNTNATIEDYAAKLRSRNVEIEIGRHSDNFIKDKDLVILSPGVDNQSLAVLKAREHKIPIISEIELGWILCPAKVIAITGTNGKTTVTTLIGEVLQAAGRRVHTCGNIGNAFVGEINSMEPEDYVSLEVSSFQLERISTFKPKISLILNFTPDHLDRYPDVNQYLEAKKRIFLNQDENDYLVLNYADPVLKNLAKDSKVNKVYFNITSTANPNYQAVKAVADILNIDKQIVSEVLENFKGIEHRMEEVAELRGIKFINDSKATNVNSTLWALNNISQPVILIAGGKDKGLPFEAVKEKLCEKVKRLILIGETRQKLTRLFQDAITVDQSETLEEATQAAFESAQPGDCVLLSPMCASFDMFLDYRERGELFKQAVKNLIKRHA